MNKTVKINKFLSHALVKISACLALVFSVSSCNDVIYDYPDCPDEPEPEYVFKVRLDFQRELPPYTDITYDFGSSRAWRGEVPEPDFRYIINVYDDDPNSRDVLYSFTGSVTGGAPESIEVPMKLPKGKYRFLAWADYVKPGTLIDLFYNTSNWAEISISKKDYIGCDNRRDAFRGESPQICSIPDEELHIVPMERPLAKYRFVSTDFDLFLQNQGYSMLPPAEGSDIPQAPNFDPDNYYIMMRYTGYLPCAFSNYTNRPSNSEVGFSYRGDFTPIGGNEVELSFDYVFVNGKEAMVDVAIDIYSKDGELLASSPSISVPLKRSKLTTVRGTFLTSKSSGSVGVNPDFNGEYNIIIP